MEAADQVDMSLGRIAAKLTEARDRGLECFGSEKHQFVLRRPLPESQVARFERDHQVELPAGYRAFLTRLGNGGAGPYYGLEPLDRWGMAIWDAPAGLARPSPLRPRMPADASPAAYLRCDEDALTDGAITLVEQGCTYSSLLIVTGPYRGAVVNIDDDFSGPPYFTRDAGFLAWYERWLDELLWGWNGSWYGFGLPGTEPELAHVLTTTPTDRADALRTLKRIHALTAATLSVVASCLVDDDPQVRAASIGLLGRQLTPASIDLIGGHLADSSAQVRIEALAALPADHSGLYRLLRAALDDADRGVLRTALRRLSDAGQLREADTSPLLAHPDPQIRRTALGFLDKIPAATVPAGMFTDTDPGVVRLAVLAAGKLGDRQAVPSLLSLLGVSHDPSLRSLTIAILGRLGDPASLSALIRETRAADDFIRLEAARALGQLADPRALDALTALLDDHTRPERRGSGTWQKSNLSIAEVARTSLRQLDAR